MSKELTPIEELIKSINDWENSFYDANKEDRFFQGAFSRCANIKRKATELLQSESTFIRKKEREAVSKAWDICLKNTEVKDSCDWKDLMIISKTEYLNENYPL